MLSPGTRGDVAPATGLGAAFVADGHEVTIVANTEYAPMVAAAGCAPAPINASMAPPRDSPGGVRAHLVALRTYMDEAATVALAASAGTDVVLANAISPYGHDIAEGLAVPSADVLLQPWQPSAAYPPMIASVKDLGRFGNRWAGRIAARVSTPYDPACRRIRADLGLPPQSRHAGQRRRYERGAPVHHGISSAVLPRPRDWPDHLSLDGFWWPHKPPAWTPPPELSEFLDSGPAPVVVSLGSIPASSAVTKAVLEALEITKVRSILQGDGLRGVAEHRGASQTLHVGDVPHDWLLPRAAAVVHHAGAGMVSAALGAGVPSVPMPMHTDQHFWARRLVAVGAASDPVPMKRADGARLAAAVREATSSRSLRDGAQAVRDGLRGEDGTRPLRTWLGELAGEPMS